MENSGESGQSTVGGEGECGFPEPSLSTIGGDDELSCADPTPTLTFGSTAPAFGGDATVEVPTHVGRYRVLSLLGEGAFGRVYLVDDEQLERKVAVKVPHRLLVPGPEAAESYLCEARAAARLDHPNIVPVYDVGSSPEFPCFIVSKFIDGRSLAQQFRARSLSLVESARLVSTVAMALHHAHERGIVHRDVKPGNIILDARGRPYVADFGLALREANFGTGPCYAGTPAYMSPEQARGEGHRVDGRSDVFSLGVVLYELITRRRPFIATTLEEILALVSEADPRPPRQLNDKIPRELERICLKALARRASERYGTARDLADDLGHFVVTANDGLDSPGTGTHGPTRIAPGLASELGSPLSTTTSQTSRFTSVPIVPRGLRSFDATDADFFLSLLPGPCDRDGQPESVRFWKTRVEQTDTDETFAVGLVYGPSGCGKSSLVKAGLIPVLANHVVPVYVEATADQTETRLIAALARRFSYLPRHGGLPSALASLRRGQALPAGEKVLIVLDQFEQWLHARRGAPEGELVEALRQCDGGRVQCLVLVRDDFWMAATRFMGELEVPLVEGHNSAAVDLFPIRHAQKVLAAFGRAFGALPDGAGALFREQRVFVEQAVLGLAQEGKVNCVRLALFAQMMKDRPWTQASLRGVGGAAGVGATFLEETFSAPGAPPEHRYHQNAAQSVLKALLPSSGTDIKGHMRSEAELLAVSGYGDRPRDFEKLMHILDSEVRLITPTDPEGKHEGARVLATINAQGGTSFTLEPSSSHVHPSSSRHYQLTHDYLVPSLRDWLTRKLRETRRGRAELRLAERTALWSGQPENRFLPPWWEWLLLRLFTRRRDWTTPQQAMMRRAARHHAVWGLSLCAALVLFGVAVGEVIGRHRAQGLRDRLLESATEDVPEIVRELSPYRRWLDRPLRKASADALASGDHRRQLHASLALLPVDQRQIGYLRERLLAASPQEAVVIRAALEPHAAQLSPWLWEVVFDMKRLPGERLRAACALARYAPADPRWREISTDVAARLVAEPGLLIARWAEALRPARRDLLPPLASLLAGEGLDPAARRTITGLYGDYARDLSDAFVSLENEAALEPPPEDDRRPQDRRRANAAVTLASLGRWHQAHELLELAPDPTARSYVIDRLGPGGADASGLVALLTPDVHASVRRGALLALGGFDGDRLPLPQREPIKSAVVRLYRDDPNPGVHGAAGWLLGHWGQHEPLALTDKALATGKLEGSRRWYLTRQGQTMVKLAPGQFTRGPGEGRTEYKIDHGFAIAAREITVAEFRRFRNEHTRSAAFALTDDCPAHELSWYDAVAYCNWLNDQEGIPKEQWCYLPNDEGHYARGMKVAPDGLNRSGYRLPTVLEWEYACRAGTVTRWSIGEAEDLLTNYAWCVSNAWSRLHPVATLRPNDLGLFDMHGNAWEWCHDVDAGVPGSLNGDAPKVITDGSRRLLRGGAFGHGPLTVQSSNEIDVTLLERGGDLGFRPARTLP